MFNRNHDDEYKNLFDAPDDNSNHTDNEAIPTDDEVDISSTDSDVFDLNSYSDDGLDDSELQPDNVDEPKKKEKTTTKKVLRTVLIIFLVCTMLGCVAVGGLVGYVIMFVDGTMDENLNMLKLNYATTIYVQDGDEWVEYQRLHGGENRIWVSYDKDKAEADDPDYTGVPQDLADAFVAIEDKRFFDHEGVDWRRTISAFVNMVTNRTTSGYGGSSITQQLVKNLTKDSDRSANRKVREIMRARYLESKFSKEVILECYMNTIAMGNGIYGVEVASEYYFGKKVNELTLAECASIAGITNLPEYYRPDKNPENNKERRDLVLKLMLEQKLITQEEYDGAIAEELNVAADSSAFKEEEVNNYFVDALIEDVVAALMEENGWEREHAETNFYNGGYKIYSTLDPDVQETIDSVYESEKYALPGDNDEPLQGSMVVMDYSGHVLGMAGGMGEKTENRGLNRATMSPRQPGSTIKPIAAYAPALEKNLITYSSIVNDKSTYYNNKTWRPVNWYRYYKGNVTVKYALEISMNTIPVYLVDLLTTQESYDFLTGTLGLKNLTNKDVDYSPLGMGGTNGGYTALESAAAFAIFGNKGKYYEPITFTKIYDQYDKLVFSQESESTVAISEDTAVIMNKLLQNVVYGNEGTAAGARSFITNMKFFAKTGTANHTNDIWFVGGSPYYVASSWCGYDELQKIDDAKRARTMWGAVMKKLHSDLKAKDFPESEYVQCKLYCSHTGLLAKTGCPVSDYGWYKTTGQKYCDSHGGDNIKGTTEKAAKEYLNKQYAETQKEENSSDSSSGTEGNASDNSATGEPQQSGGADSGVPTD